MAALPADFNQTVWVVKKKYKVSTCHFFFQLQKGHIENLRILRFFSSLPNGGNDYDKWSLLFVALQAAISRLKLPNLINCGAKAMDLDHPKCSQHLNPWKMNGWNLHQITHERKGNWSEPNLHLLCSMLIFRGVVSFTCWHHNETSPLRENPHQVLFTWGARRQVGSDPTLWRLSAILIQKLHVKLWTKIPTVLSVCTI